MQLCVLFSCSMNKPPLSLGPASVVPAYSNSFKQHQRDLVLGADWPHRARQESTAAFWLFQQTPREHGQAAVTALAWFLQNPTA